MMIARAGRKRNVMKMTDAGHAMQVGMQFDIELLED